MLDILVRTPKRIWLTPGQAQDPTECTLSHVNTDGHSGVPYILDPDYEEIGLPAPENASERDSAQSSPIPADSAESSPHPFVGIPAGELGMSPCEHCKLPERDLIHSLKFQHTTPETITISLPALRAVIFNAIDTKTWKFYWHEWANSDTAENEAIEHCREFVDLICEHLRQLPARG